MGGSINGDTPKMDGFIMNKPINMDDLGVPLFHETTKSTIEAVNQQEVRLNQ